MVVYVSVNVSCIRTDLPHRSSPKGRVRTGYPGL